MGRKQKAKVSRTKRKHQEDANAAAGMLNKRQKVTGPIKATKQRIAMATKAKQQQTQEEFSPVAETVNKRGSLRSASKTTDVGLNNNAQMEVPPAPKVGGDDAAKLIRSRKGDPSKERSPPIPCTSKADNSKSVKEKGVAKKVRAVCADVSSDEEGELEDYDRDSVQVAVNASDDDYSYDSESQSESESDMSGSDELSDGESESDHEVQVRGRERRSRSRSRARGHPDWQQELKENPDAQRYIDQIVAAKVKKQLARASRTPERKGREIGPPKGPGIKSPSDTTLYAPALSRKSRDNNVINRISNFVEGMRLDGSRSRSPTPRNRHRSSREHSERREHQRVRERRSETPHGGSTVSEGRQPREERHADDDSVGNSEAACATLDAERFKAKVVAPKGRFTYEELAQLRKEDTDDDFFHVTCHIEKSLREKIERGEYVDLDRLLPKERCGGSQIYREDRELKFFERDGTAFFAPAQEAKVNSVRKWDQAFRVYAAIYTTANPERASEIWQYVHVINVAATTFPWDNVAYYDFTFRQLMAEKPWRSWAKTYTQGWNLAMRGQGPVGGTGYGFNNNKPSFSRAGASTSSTGPLPRDDTCWRFNKATRCPLSAASCKWEHYCSYCKGRNHGFFNCRKRLRKEGKLGDGQEQALEVPRAEPPPTAVKKTSNVKGK